MPKPLPMTDFRARRIVLTRDDFAYAPNPAPKPSDVIGKPSWQSIVTLPDDVAVRTSNYHGTALRQLNDLWGAWVECFGDDHDFMFSVMLDAGDDFQAALYANLTGFYRLSVTALRSALELSAIGTWAQVCGKKKEFNNWRGGKMPLSFGQACDGLYGATKSLSDHLKQVVDDGLFQQRTQTTEGGFLRRIFEGLSNFTHSRPGYADGDIRTSNGPIYVQSAFNHVSWMEFETIGACFVLLLLSRPKQKLPKPVIELFDDVSRLKSRVTRAAFQFLYAGVA